MNERLQQAVAEFFGALALIFIGAGSVVVLRGQDFAGLVGIALAHGLVLAIFISAVGHVSGGHFNPAVTIGAWVAGKIESSRAALYIVSQLAGAAGGALLLRLAIPKAVWESTKLGTPLVNASGSAFTIGSGKAVLLEGILTFFLVFVVFGVAVDDRGAFDKIAGLPIGLVLTFDILVGGPFTGAAMNPARAFGPELVSGTWTDWWVYWVGPIAGAVVAATIYWFVFLRSRETVSAPKTETPVGGGPENES